MKRIKTINTMKTRPFFCIMLAMFMSMINMDSFAYDIEVANSDGVTIYYTFQNNNTELAVTYCGSTYTGNVVIPELVTFERKTFPVTSIGNHAFRGCFGLTSVTIPSSVTSIGNYAFRDCSGLTSVKMERETPPSINSSSFDKSTNAIIYVPDGSETAYQSDDNWWFLEIVEYSMNIAFADENVKAICVQNWDTDGDGELSYEEAAAVTNLGEVFRENTDISLFDELRYFTGLTRIGYGAFSGCSSLTSVTIPNSVTYIGISAFRECSGLTSVSIPNSVTEIGIRAFEGCSGLTSIAIPNNMRAIPNYMFQGCSALTEITIPSSVTFIGSYAFNNCSSLASVTIPNSVTSIGQDAFYGCSGLTKTEFASIEQLCNMNFGNSVSSPLYYAHHLYINDEEIEDLVIPNGVKSIGNYAFIGCSEITSVIIPECVTNIGNDAFSGCSSLTSVRVGNTTPLTISQSVFTNRANAILHVLAGSKAAYEMADYWNEFKEIVEYDKFFVSDVGIVKGYSRTLTISLCNKEPDIVSFQMDIALPQGITLDNAACSLSNRFDDDNLELTIIQQANGTYRLTCNSFGLNAYDGTNSDIITLSLRAFESAQSGSVVVSNIMFTTSNNEEIQMDDISSQITVYEWGDAHVDRIRPIPVYQKTFDVDTDYYIYNVGRGMFVNKGEAGETQATLGYQGMKYQIKHDDDMPEGYYYLYSEETGKNNKVTFRTNSDGNAGLGVCAAFVDNNKGPNAYWTITPFNDDVMGGFLIQIPENNVGGGHPFVATQAWGAQWNHWGKFFDSNGITNGIFFDVEIADNPDNVTWQFVTVDYYESYQDGLDTEAIDAFNAANDLKQCIDMVILRSADVSGDDICYAMISYENYNSSADELCAAIDALRPFMIALRDALATLQSTISHAAALGIDTTDAQTIFDNPQATLEDIKAAIDALKCQINHIYVNETSVLLGSVSTLTINLKNTDPVNMMDFYLQLPEGMSIADDSEGYPDVSLVSNRSNNHQVQAQWNEAGYYHIVCYSSQNNAFNDNDGALFNIALACAPNITAGNYEGTVMNILMSDTEKNSITHPNFSFGIEALDLQMGDVNGDGKINGLDIVEMVDYIMQRPSESFYFAAANLQNDMKINGLDLVKLVNLVLKQGITPSAAHVPAMKKIETRKGELFVKNNGNCTLTMGIDSSDGFILTQCVVEISEGIQLKDIIADDNHVVAWQPIDESRYAVVAYSAKNSEFKANDSLLTFNYIGKGSINVSNAMLVDKERNERHFSSAGLDVVTILNAIEINGNVDIYDLQGRKMAKGGLPKGVFIVNGKKVIAR